MALVVHPGTVVDRSGLRELVARSARDRGWCAPRWLKTTCADAGSGVAARALRDDPDLVVACGGDGTVNAVAAVLSHTEDPMGIGRGAAHA